MGLFRHRHHRRRPSPSMTEAVPRLEMLPEPVAETDDELPKRHHKRHRKLFESLIKYLFITVGSLVIMLAFFTVALLLLYLLMNSFTHSPFT